MICLDTLLLRYIIIYHITKHNLLGTQGQWAITCLGTTGYTQGAVEFLLTALFFFCSSTGEEESFDTLSYQRNVLFYAAQTSFPTLSIQ